MNILKISDKGMKLRKSLRAGGMGGVVMGAMRYLKPPKPKTLQFCKDLVAGRRGLEIGGPSQGFSRRGFIPIYSLVAGLDNCNFSSKTVWEGTLAEGLNFQYDPNHSPGRQYIAEGTDLRMIPSNSYDFVLSCHSIEHTANPIRALKEWSRLLKEDGGLVLVVPHKEGTFDHRRPTTTLQHLIEDFQKNTGEDDMTHLDEILKYHDIDRDWGSVDMEAFKKQCLQNPQNRCMHQHAFNTPLVAEMVDYAGYKILSVEALKPFHCLVTAKKSTAKISNESFLSRTASWRRESPFEIDR